MRRYLRTTDDLCCDSKKCKHVSKYYIFLKSQTQKGVNRYTYSIRYIENNKIQQKNRSRRILQSFKTFHLLVSMSIHIL